jgi:outer membrane protein TolC
MSRVVTATFVLLVTALGAAAAPPLRLEEVVAEALRHNPALRAVRARAAGAATVPTRVSALDDPVVSWEAWNFPDGVRVDRADNNIFRLSQRLPFPGKRGLAGAVAARDAEVAGREADAAALDVVAAVKAAYWDLWRAHQVLHVYARERGIMDRFAQIAEQRYAAGGATQADAVRAQVELTRLLNRESTQRLAVTEAEAELNALLSREAGVPLGVPEEPANPRLDATPEALTRLALADRPELAGLAAAVAREEAGVRLARRDYLPDFEVAGSRFLNYGADDGFGAFFSVTVPLAYKRKYDAALSEAEARLASAQAERRRLEDAVRRDVAQGWARARAALLQHELLVHTHIPQAEQALRVTESGYQTGALDFGALTDTARTIETIHLEHYDAAAAFEKALAALERAVGTPRDRWREAGEGSEP